MGLSLTVGILPAMAEYDEEGVEWAGGAFHQSFDLWIVHIRSLQFFCFAEPVARDLRQQFAKPA